MPYIKRIGKPPAPMLDNNDGIVMDNHVFVVENDGIIIDTLVFIEQNGQNSS